MDALFCELDKQSEAVVELQSKLTAIPALGPMNGGDGEKEKAEFLLDHLKSMGLADIREFNAPDPSVPCGYRPNIAAVIPGKKTSQTLWVISHIDVVPPGDLSLWNSDPYTMIRNGDILIGRGVEDNQQGIVSSILTAQALLDLKITPEINYGLLFVADEETGSTFGLDYLVREHEDLFAKNDLFLIPDFGEPNSEMVEVAEKSMFWLKIIIQGKQCHASTPAQGLNTLVPCAEFILRIKDLEAMYPAENPIYDPPCSTFQPTMKEANVANINTIPGRDVFYVDSRVMPEYDVAEVLDTIKGFGKEIEQKYGVAITYEVTQSEQAAPATPVDSEIAIRTIRSVKKVYNNNPRTVGVGGGTVAAFLRRKGYQAVVWATLNHNAHQPNESASIKSTIGDAKVIGDILLTS
ncbi:MULTISPECIES: M20 family metallo-hydrolase [unclassified Pseudodesulfovibrio]|uniref:M20 family metallo-hydrolase n=1 Tax=unclassified Pseudodesulfovibrio TaxID=2661612 RepID=UPI000FEBA7B1|nr:MULTISPECIES: M20 family metallo-hydrolase [unclassified Pseudodesulfovibrio]MCJ2163900.1 M20 family metallo-hydrolase [Pseudodesulfovibrio sp. S3-i]RWU05855.1 M20 family metallo-hydrolase [Pseudodesulfovibrio sp. S3]